MYWSGFVTRPDAEGSGKSITIETPEPRPVTTGSSDTSGFENSSLPSSRTSESNGPGPKKPSQPSGTEEAISQITWPASVVWQGVNEAIQVDIASILHHLGLEGEHFAETPRRVATLLREFTTGVDPATVLNADFEETQDNILVVQTSIPFKGLCAHHLLPFWGYAAVGYIPRKRVVGLSKLSRLVSASGTQFPSTQEHITNLIVDTLNDALEPIGAGVLTSAAHACMAVRGVNAPTAITKVSALRGQLLLNSTARAEFMALVGGI
jgi:GTP cyclohydrolase I